MELTTQSLQISWNGWLFMMSKIQNLNGTHNITLFVQVLVRVVYDVKDTKFEWNSQHFDGDADLLECCL